MALTMSEVRAQLDALYVTWGNRIMTRSMHRTRMDLYREYMRLSRTARV